MTRKYAIDFGTTNTVIARWDDAQGAVEIVTAPGLSASPLAGAPPVIPSLVYVQDGRLGRVSVGQTVRDGGLDRQRDNRLFRNFKRGIIVASVTEPREIDGAAWADRDAGRSFIRSLLEAIWAEQTGLEQLVLTAPVAAFEGYLAWLGDVMEGYAPESIRIVDESTAAALGYAVTEPGAIVLVLDFGGGTLDLSLVQLPESREKTGGILERLRLSPAAKHSARVLAKAGRAIGGSDIDQWMLAETLRRAGLAPQALGADFAALLTHCEQAKIALSAEETATVTFQAAGQSHSVVWTRAELEALLEAQGFYTALRRAVDKVIHVAHQRSIFKEDIHCVLLVGGTSLMPSVQRTLQEFFAEVPVRADKPFTAIAEGALQVAAGFGVDDYLVHSYGLRHLDPESGEHRYDEIVPMGSRYPIAEPVEVVLGAAHEGQAEVEFVIAEIDTDVVSMVEVQYEGGQAVFVAQAERSAQRIVPVNAPSAETVARLDPPGAPGPDRLVARFTVDDERRLRLTVVDLQTRREVLRDVVVATLR